MKPSFYHEVRTEPDMVARREWTHEWWDNHIADYDAYSSEAVIKELEGGSFDSPMILFDDVIKVLALSNRDPFMMVLIILLDRRRVSTALIDVDQSGLSISTDRFGEKP